MSIDITLHVWDAEKADGRWLEWMELSPDERADSEPQEIVEGVLEILAMPDANEAWVTGRLAMLDLAFGQVGEAFPVDQGRMIESYAAFFLIAFCGCEAEDEKPPSLGLFLHPTFYRRMLETVDEDSIRALDVEGLTDAQKDGFVAFWNSVAPAFRAAVAADGGRGNVVVVDGVNGETDNRLLTKRAESHAEWMRRDT